MSTKPIPLNAKQIRLLAVLALVNFVNFAARQVIAPLIPLLRDHFHATDAQLGALQMWLLVVLAVFSIPFGFFADRFNRVTIIVIGVACWSVATVVSGLASTFIFLLFARAAVGLGEAAYAPAAQSMISAPFRKRTGLALKPSSPQECCWVGSEARRSEESLGNITAGSTPCSWWGCWVFFPALPSFPSRNPLAAIGPTLCPFGVC